jgi:hypothetical protein
MVDGIRKKSPRAPSMPLDEAVERAIRAYDKERRHPAPIEAMAQSLGYKGANSGTALKAIASLRYFGLLERPGEGQLAISKDVESYQYAPSEDLKRELRIRWLKNPPVFSDLLDKFKGGLPSDVTLKYELIQKGFLPDSAAEVLSVFRQSVEFARFFESESSDAPQPKLELAPDIALASGIPEAEEPKQSVAIEPLAPIDSSSMDRIPVRLSGGRRAWLVIPEPFFAADKERLKAQIDLLLTED